MSSSDTVPPILPDNRPYTLAAAFLASRGCAWTRWGTEAGGLQVLREVGATRLRHWREEFYEFRACVYRRVVAEELVSDLTVYLNGVRYFDGAYKERSLRVTRGLEGDVVSQLRRLCQVRAESVPAWLDSGERPDPRRVIAFRNGLLDVDAWLDDPAVALEPPTEQWFSEAVLPCHYAPAAACPRWLRFLNQSLEGDAELVALLQEFFGYCLTGDTSLQKLLWLHGVSGSGKSTVVHMLRNVVGEGSCVSFDLWSLLGNFTLSSFLGKRLATSADAHLGHGNEADKVLSKLKGISAGDEQNVDRKNREMLSSIRLSVRFVISTNEFPNLPDASDALARRALFVPFDRTFRGDANPRLAEELQAELAGVTVWALQGLRRLLGNAGRFTESAAARRVSAEFRRLQSPVHAFVEDCCTVGDYVAPTFDHDGAGHIEVGALYRAFSRWAEVNGRGKLSSAKFGERLRRAVPTVRRARPRDDGGRTYQYQGIDLTEEARSELLTSYGGRAQPTFYEN